MGTLIQPTRAELLVIRRRIILYESVHRILNIKLHAMTLECVRVIREAIDQRKETMRLYQEAVDQIAVASMMEGMEGVALVATAVETIPYVEVTQRNVVGVLVPVFEGVQIQKSLEERGYGLLGTTSIIDEVTDAYEQLTVSVVRQAEHEASMKRLLTEIERTRRRVNALEFRIIPDLQATKERIEFLRDELEREEFIRLRKIKKLKQSWSG